MTAKHMTGWHIDRSEGTKIKDGDGNTVLWTQHTHLQGRRTDDEVMQIAHLAAAAPELLEALKRFASMDYEPIFNPFTRADFEAARAAISKAGGTNA